MNNPVVDEGIRHVQVRYRELIEQLATELHHARGWKRKVAKKLGITPEHLSRILHTGRFIGWGAIENATNTLGIDREYFYSPTARSYRDYSLPIVSRLAPTTSGAAVPLKSVEGFQKFDGGKTRLSILMSASRGLALIADVMWHGAEKYDRDNWKKCTDPARYRDAMYRHMGAIEEGEVLDPDSKLPHVAHVATNAVFLCWFHARESK